MENPLFHRHSVSYLESISINSVECIRLWRQIFERFPEMAMICAQKCADNMAHSQSKRFEKSKSAARHSGSKYSAWDFWFCFVCVLTCRKRKRRWGCMDVECYSSRSTWTRKIITGVVCLFAQPDHSPTRLIWRADFNLKSVPKPNFVFLLHAKHTKWSRGLPSSGETFAIHATANPRCGFGLPASQININKRDYSKCKHTNASLMHFH